ncbi:methyl-accepting chemotaxis protein [Bordetella sp. 02P26C-1]|uniref:methyl-accepting chemotaxis protein n=1 Tax=Bordetella sp. 02P26C-1 TaxID=2683195 RepID=UPI0013561971|nr:PAS domain-containing methyl-accepting chemotaxis protein [Bordetella sp. 02P26C-1]MVW78242.1 PAS domain-containing protein [Bordetella sp. 02P26C-1]
MRKNLPVTNVETQLKEDQYLISKTDLKGRITFCNPEFVKVSGFEAHELLGKPHNIVRHPDMPEPVFKEMWETLQAFKPWVGVVKNRRKDGGFYWVLATVLPIMEQDTCVGYASVRVRATAEAIRGAEQFYEGINRNDWGGYTVKHGQRVPAGWRKLLNRAGMVFSTGLRAALLRSSAFTLAMAAIPTYLASSQFSETGRAWLWAGYAATAALVLASNLRLCQRLTRPLSEAERLAGQITGGNLIITVPQQAEAELKQLFFYLDTMRKSLSGITSEVTERIQSNALTTEHLKESSQDLASRTEQQAASLQETAASLEELTMTVKQNADNAVNANRLSSESMEIASTGGAVVGEVVQTMRSIQSSSRKISEIVSLIDGIAFQTNILALNAAVEAARAGEKGKGFAVVAGEVRSLAQKTSEAAKEIKTLIDTSVAGVELGAQQAERAGKTMNEIVEAVSRVGTLMNEISTASAEQTKGLEQINVAVNQLDSVTHQNAGLVQDLIRSADDISRESQTMRDAVAVFNTKSAA